MKCPFCGKDTTVSVMWKDGSMTRRCPDRDLSTWFWFPGSTQSIWRWRGY